MGLVIRNEGEGRDPPSDIERPGSTDSEPEGVEATNSVRGHGDRTNAEAGAASAAADATCEVVELTSGTDLPHQEMHETTSFRAGGGVVDALAADVDPGAAGAAAGAGGGVGVGVNTSTAAGASVDTAAAAGVGVAAGRMVDDVAGSAMTMPETHGTRTVQSPSVSLAAPEAEAAAGAQLLVDYLFPTKDPLDRAEYTGIAVALRRGW